MTAVGTEPVRVIAPAAAPEGAWRGAVIRRTGARRRGYRATKRAVDVVGALLGLFVLAPVLLLAVATVRLDSPGRALFRQERVGARRRRGPGEAWVPVPFTIFKLRTMFSDADDGVHEERIRRYVRGLPIDGHGPASKPGDDARITRAGRFLRAWSLDELPQLLNVLRGEMSLVGPRPVPPYEADAYTPEHLVRFATRPGITGLWQVSGRSDLGFRDVVALDLEYVDRQSLVLDVRILLRTITTVLTRRGAA